MKLVFLLIGFLVCATATAEEKPFHVPSDPKARYFVLGKGGHFEERIIVTKRVGSSGTSFSRRVYNCTTRMVKYLGSGDSIEAMNQSRPDPNMAPIVPGAIADYVGMEACRRN